MISLTINNFRSLINQKFDFSDINVLIGENSSGKSSLIKFLLFLKNSKSLNSKSFQYSSDTGKYEDFIYQHNEKFDITFEFEFGQEYIDFFIENFENDDDWSIICDEIKQITKEKHIVSIKYEFSKTINNDNQIKAVIESNVYGNLTFERNIENDGKKILNGRTCRITYNDSEEEVEIFDSIGYDQHGFMTYVHGSELQKKINERYNESGNSGSDVLYQEMGFLLIVQNYLDYFLENITYINPLESKPERVYQDNGNQGLYKINGITDVINILTDKEYVPEETRDFLLNQLNEAIRDYGILHEIKPIDSGFGAKEIKVKVSSDSVWTNIKDVGHGSTLQIPIIFQCILSNFFGGEILVIEQPEIHIHPFLQSKFIETIVKIGPKNTYIIETHSEDIVRKLQILVKHNQYGINSSSVKIYYFKRGANDNSQISKHELNDFGKIIPPFPSGFYDSSVLLVKELL